MNIHEMKGAYVEAPLALPLELMVEVADEVVETTAMEKVPD